MLRIQALIDSEQLQEALFECQQALKATEDLHVRADIYCLMAKIHAKNESLNETITAYLNAIKLDSENLQAWKLFADTIQDVAFNQYHETIKQIIITGLNKSGLDHQKLSIPGISLLKLSPSFIFNHSQIEEKIKLAAFDLLEDRLFIRLLEKVLLPDSEIEQLIVEIRKSLLLSIQHLSKKSEPFLFALARYCFFCEYIFIETPEESKAIKALLSMPSMTKASIAILACYRPLLNLPFSHEIIELAKTENDSAFSNLVKEQLVEPLEEEEEIIPIVKPISDNISQKVASQYEENPYPRWKSANINPDLKNFEKKEILIAGCGTGQHAINTAFMHPNADILAIDISRKSLAYAIRKAKEFNLKNIQFLQVDLLDLECLNRTFDLIECYGVLHHMEDPVKGWRILIKLLRPSGIMGIGLYSEIARRDVVMTRKFIDEHGFVPTLESVRLCRQKILTLSKDDPIYGLSHSLDFYSFSGCRDLLFHVQEQRYTLTQIQEILKELRLKVVKVELNKQTLKKYRDLFPDDVEATSLENWEKFETEYPHTFTGMYAFQLAHTN